MLPILSFSQSLTDYVFIKGGTFKMGTNNAAEDEMPVHKVKISDFYVLNHEVTNQEYVNFLNHYGNQYQSHVQWIALGGNWRNIKCRIYNLRDSFYVQNGYENFPVTYVNWYGANAYANWVGGRLPTEAEWEYLANLSQKSIDASLDSLKKYAWFKENSDNLIHQVKTKNPILGIYDLFGNLSEWCLDWYSSDYYKNSTRKNSVLLSSGVQKVKRGGSFATNFSSITKSNRKASNPTNNNITIGFRVIIPVN